VYRVVCGTQVSLGCSWRRCLSALSGSPTHSLKRSCQVRETKRNHTQTHILSCLGLVCCTCVHCTAKCIIIAPKRLKFRLSGSARKSQKRFRDTPMFKFQAVLTRTQPFLSRSVEKRGDQSRFKCRKMANYCAIRSTLRYEKRALPRQARDKHKGKSGNKKRLLASVALAGRSLGRTCLACQHHNHQQCQHRKGSHLTQRYTSFKLVLNFCVVELKQNRIIWSLLLSAEGTEGST
jgi:hypothetical protein